jgi:hypothetical protein
MSYRTLYLEEKYTTFKGRMADFPKIWASEKKEPFPG